MPATMVRRLHFCFMTALLLIASGCVSDPLPIAIQPPRAAVPPLIGLDRRSVESHWGSPALLRAEGPGEMWQYRSADCVVDIFFYPSADALRVAHLTVRPAGWSAPHCLNRPVQSAGLTG